jgi:hypothetical protein
MGQLALDCAPASAPKSEIAPPKAGTESAGNEPNEVKMRRRTKNGLIIPSSPIRSVAEFL